MPELTVNGVRYHVETQGQSAPILLLHGFTGSLANWSPLTAALEDRYRVIAVDLLGHGQTESPPNAERYRIEHAAADLIELLNHLKSGSVHLLGYSMGGRLALYMALNYPDRFRSLILESASPGLEQAAERNARKASDDALADRIEREGIPAFVDYWEGLPLFATQSVLPATTRNALRAQRLKNTPTGLANSLRGMGTGVQPSLWDALPQLRTPVLLLTGALDAKFTGIAQQMQVRIARSEFVGIPDAGHTVHLERPVPYQDLIRRSLSEKDPG